MNWIPGIKLLDEAKIIVSIPPLGSDIEEISQHNGELPSELETLITEIENAGADKLSKIADPILLLTYLHDINNFPGLIEAKNQIAYHVRYLISTGFRTEAPILHTILTAPPNDREYYAQLLANIWSSVGTIKNSRVRTVTRSDFIGPYLGTTARKTRNLLESMSESVLMIDEAYSLNNGLYDEFGTEAIDALNDYLSTHSNPTVITTNPSSNPNLNRKFIWRFSSQTTDEPIAIDSSEALSINHESSCDQSMEANITDTSQYPDIFYDTSIFEPWDQTTSDEESYIERFRSSNFASI